MTVLSPSQILRLISINRILIRHGLDEIVFAIHLLRPVRFLLYLLPWNWFRGDRGPRAVRIRRTLEDLGPIFIKFGQMLSTRRDLLPDDIAVELAKLQDAVPPFPGEEARRIVEKSLGGPVGEHFACFDEAPMASASIAQVHSATLCDGSSVVVKVVRPNIERTIRRDIELMYIVAELAERYWSEGPRLRPREVVAEYERTILDELDLTREAANATQLRGNFENSPLLYIPKIYWDQTRRNVLVMERIRGIPVSDTEALRDHGIDLVALSERGVEIFFTQVFKHNFFHADMHPGNIFVNPEHPADPQYMAVDFGIVGALTPSDQRYLAENFHAFFNRDYRRVAELHIESGWVPPGTSVVQFESAIRTVCEPIFHKPLKEISFGYVLLTLFQTARRFHMEVQPQLVLLQKTLLNIEGLGRQLNPDLDLWKTAKPFIQRWMDEQVGARALVRGLKKYLPQILEKLPEMPGLIHEIASRTVRNELTLRYESRDLKRMSEEMRASHRRTLAAITGGALLVAAVLLIRTGEPAWLGLPWATWVPGLAGTAMLLGAWWPRTDARGR